MDVQVATSAARAATNSGSAAAIGRVLGRAADAARSVGDEALEAAARQPFRLLEHSEGQIQALIADMRASLAWVDEGNCFNRAMYGAHLLGQRSGTGLSPLADEFAAAVAVSPHLHDGGTYTGGFHAAMAVRVRGREGLQVIDLLEGHASLEPLATWTRHPDPLVLRPWAGTGIWDGVSRRSTWVGAPYFDDAERRLAASLTADTSSAAAGPAAR